jgi:hypothetical protein
VVGNWIELHNGEIYNLYTSMNMRVTESRSEIGRSCSMYGGDEKCIKFFCWKT